MNTIQFQHQFFEGLASPAHGEEIFDGIADTVYFIKDDQGRYVSVNNTLVRRCHKESKSDLIGKTASEVFPSPLGDDFTEQDFEVLRGGPEIHNRLELHLYPGGESGWCLTWKKVLFSQEGKVAGLAGISRDVGSQVDSSSEFSDLAVVLEYIRDHLDGSLSLDTLSSATGLSAFQIAQRMKSLFGLTPHQYIIRSRIESACHQLVQTKTSLSEIALACGFSDQSSFSRQFKRSVGMTPKAFRNQGERL